MEDIIVHKEISYGDHVLVINAEQFRLIKDGLSTLISEAPRSYGEDIAAADNLLKQLEK